MTPAQWIRKFKVTWQRWPSWQELRHQYPNHNELKLQDTLQRVIKTK